MWINYERNYELNYNKNKKIILFVSIKHIKKNSSLCKEEQYDFVSTMTNTHSKENPNS